MAFLQHPTLGTTQGIACNDVVKFCGIQYATLQHKFAPPILLKPRNGPGQILDATSYGPRVPGPDGCDFEFDLIQHRLPREPQRSSQTMGLSLNVVTPRTAATTKTLLPTLVFLHGGGLATGSATWPQNDITRLIELSLELGLPTVGVSVNYRTGPAGFMTSQELRDAGFTCNNGLRDQRVALEWVKENIPGFGGDPWNVTLVGHSAGGASATYHLAHETELFKRVACLSGQCLAVRPLPSEVHEELYASAVQTLGLDQVPRHERIARMQNLSDEQLGIISGLPSRPIVDGDICRIEPSYQAIEGGMPLELHRGWCKDIFIGNCLFDGSILAGALEHRKCHIADTFARHLTTSLPRCAESVIATLLSGYHVTKENTDEGAFEGVLHLANDIMFEAPTLAIARSWSRAPETGSAYVYQFNQPNPWPGRWEGQPSHVIDLTLLLQNYIDFLPSECKEVGREYATKLLQFVSGMAPWQAFDGPTRENDDGFKLKSFGNVNRDGRKHIGPLMKELGGDRLLEILEVFIAGRQ